MATRRRFRPEQSLPTVSLILSLVCIGVCTAFVAGTRAQSELPKEFEVVSIKRVDGLQPGGSLRILPDGTFMATNQALATLLNFVLPAQTGEIVGVPEWMKSESYDVTAKPPTGWTREQLMPAAYSAMWRAVLTDRMKLRWHVEQREQDAFSLVLARGDERLGPGLKPSTGCMPRADNGPITPQTAPSLQERRTRCGLSMGPGVWVSGGVTLVDLARSMRGLAGGEVEDRTGLTGDYSLDLSFSLERNSPAALSAGTPVNVAPDFVTALQEQLGLKLQREKKQMPTLVIDHVERPTAN